MQIKKKSFGSLGGSPKEKQMRPENLNKLQMKEITTLNGVRAKVLT